MSAGRGMRSRAGDLSFFLIQSVLLPLTSSTFAELPAGEADCLQPE